MATTIKLKPTFKREQASTGLMAVGHSNSRRGADVRIRDEEIAYLTHSKAHHSSARDDEPSEWSIWIRISGATNRRLKVRVPGEDYAVAQQYVRDNIDTIYAVYARLNPPGKAKFAVAVETTPATP